jgi:hypothetical protein
MHWNKAAKFVKSQTLFGQKFKVIFASDTVANWFVGVEDQMFAAKIASLFFSWKSVEFFKAFSGMERVNGFKNSVEMHQDRVLPGASLGGLF